LAAACFSTIKYYISSDGEWDSDFDDDDEENRGDEEAGTTNAQQPPHDSGAYDPEPIEGTSEYAMKVHLVPKLICVLKSLRTHPKKSPTSIPRI
jgi:hypothetical protein